MATKHTSLFLPEEHRIISEWLDVEPKEKVSTDLSIDDALKNLNLDPEELNIHSTEEYAVAAIMLERVQGRLPQIQILIVLFLLLLLLLLFTAFYLLFLQGRARIRIE